MGTTNHSGLGSIDVMSKYTALRIPWIHRIIQGKGWNDIILQYFEPMEGLEFLLRCNYDTDFLKWIPEF